MNLPQKAIAGIVILGGAVAASALVFAYLAYFVGQQAVPPTTAPPTTAALPEATTPARPINPSPSLLPQPTVTPSPGIPVPAPNLLTPLSPSPATTASSPTAPGSNQSKVQESLKGFFAKQTGVPIRSITCPATVQPIAGNAFECQVAAENINFPIQVQVRNNQGDYRIEAKGLLVLAQLEQQIQTTVKEKTGVTIKANCGTRLRMTKPGETFQCQATSDQGQTKAVVVTVEDDKGSIRWRI